MNEGGQGGQAGRAKAPDERPREAIHLFVIPGRVEREPGIHTPDGGYGFRACAKRRIPE
jgi:hypothetical protein